jgi:glycosyltransferase involved in cell wall biosynthesis
MTPAYPPFPGGGEHYTRSLAKNLANRGHQITVVTSAAQTESDFWRGTDTTEIYRKESEGSIQVIGLPLKGIIGGYRGLLVWRKAMVVVSSLPGDRSSLLTSMARQIPPITGLRTVLSRMKGSNFDLVHAFNISWEYPIVAAWRWAKETSRPLVITPYTHVGSSSGDKVARNNTMDHQRRIMRDARILFTLTGIEREKLIEWDIKPVATQVIGGALDPLPELMKEHDLLKKLGIAEPFVIFVGRNSYEKGAIHAIKAALRLNEQGVSMTLVLAGQGSPEFERLYRTLTNRERLVIRKLGIVGDQVKHQLLESATALLLPSRTDSFGIVLLEAWAHGKPVIGARAGGIPDVIDDEDNGILVPFGDVKALAESMRRLLTDRKLAVKMGRHGHQKVITQYTWDNVGDRVIDGYRSILKPN